MSFGRVPAWFISFVGIGIDKDSTLIADSCLVELLVHYNSGFETFSLQDGVILIVLIVDFGFSIGPGFCHFALCQFLESFSFFKVCLYHKMVLPDKIEVIVVIVNLEVLPVAVFIMCFFHC